MPPGTELPAGRFYFNPQYPTDKFESGLNHEYIQVLQALKYKQINLLEIGVAEGGSLNYFADYFQHPKTKIIGIDLFKPIRDPGFRDNVEFIVCDQNDKEKLQEIAVEHGKFDIILDDGAHTKKETATCFKALFKHLKPGGYYLIEDWAAELFDGEKYKGMIDLMLDLVRQNIGVRVPEFTLKVGDKCSYLIMRKKFPNAKTKFIK